MRTDNDLFKKINKKTKAIFISPVLGNPPDLARILCNSSSNIPIIIDGCDSLGTKFRNLHLGEWCDVITNSFYPTHLITTLEGGMISSDNKELIDIARSMSTWGRACTCVGEQNLLPNGSCNKRFSDWLGTGDIIDHRYVFSEMGYNLKPLDLRGALGLSQLNKFDEIKISHIYAKRIPL